ncbi:MAG: uroporphyrinogen decarboxylase family protein [Armatimonadota bacterium]
MDQTAMIPRERLLTTLSRRTPDKVPYTMGFNREAVKIYQKESGYENVFEAFEMLPDEEPIAFHPTKVSPERYIGIHGELRPGTYFNEWGTAFEPGSNPAFDHFTPALAGDCSVQDILDYPMPDLKDDYRHNDLEARVKDIQNRGFAVHAIMPMTIFEVAWQIRGFNDLLLGFLTDEEASIVLLDRITDLRVFQSRRFAEAGSDILHVGDDVGMEDRMILSPEVWRRWLKPRLAQVIKSALDVKPDILIHYHSDGYIEPIIPDLIEIGVNVLNPVQPECMDPKKLKHEYGDHLAFWGTMGTQTTMPFGSTDEVRRVVKDMIETVGKGGGLVIAPTHSLEPEVPWENVVAFVEAVREYGRY